MRFSRYLQDTQISEWKKAYIDYHGLKVQLRIIRAKIPRSIDTWSSFGGPDVNHTRYSVPDDEKGCDDPEEGYLNRRNTTLARIASEWVSETDAAMNGTTDSSGRGPFSSMTQRTRHRKISSFSLTRANLPLRLAGRASSPQMPLLPRTHRSHPAPPLFQDSASSTLPTLDTILSTLPAIHVKFFDLLDVELVKVETFYAERAKEMHERAKMLRKQLDELGTHRRMFYESSAHSKAQNWAKSAYLSISSALSSLIRRFRDKRRSARRPPGGRRPNGNHTRSWRQFKVTSSTAETVFSTASSMTLNDSAGLPRERWNNIPSVPPGGKEHTLDPCGYQHAKRQLQHAVIEHYRGLEVLNNYRIVNITGFRKALKKYEKITKISVMDAYMKEKVEPSAFGSGAMVSTMLKQMENLFAMRFEHGDRKKAMDHLRVGSSSKTQHSSTFRSGLWLGLALPAIAGGSYLSFQEHTRGSLPSWNILVYIYSIFVIPILLALLIGVNILVWANEKISYVFILRLDLRTRLDHHEYFELPSFLLCTLAYAFWFSLAQIGPAILWPLIWLALALAVMFNPLRNFMRGRARRWIIKTIAKLGASGVWEVEFADAWLGDQLCSLGYSLSNLYFVGCFYTHFSLNPASSTVHSQINSESSLYTSISVNVTALHQTELSARGAFQSMLPSAYAPQAQDAWLRCGSAQNWGWYYVLGMLPFMVRCVQNLRRYWDSKLPSQLVNAGKYAMGMINYFFYCYWRHQMSPRTGNSYILWCFTAVANAIYGCAWDFTMDWGLCKPHARYPLLRPELVYKSQISCYYLAMISDLCLRFIWLLFVFTDPSRTELYSFIVAFLEMLRRVQWNFYRLENKHLHNTGLHRITREVPLPYDFSLRSPSDGDALLRKRIARLS